MRQVDNVVEDSEPEREQRRKRDDITEDDSDSLSRFTYKSSLSSSCAPPSVDSTSSKPVRIVRKDPPDPQLAQLSKCIGCGLQWTARKTTKQKRAHIEQCAKKNALSKDTIKFLIEKETAVLLPSSRIPASDLSQNATGTLMGSVVPTGPVKKFKRQQVIPTVRSLTETRENILDRARDILRPAEGQGDRAQSTQQFGRSVLACQNIQQPTHPVLLSVNKFMEEPPSTQPLGTSALRRTIMNPEWSVDGCGESSFLPTQQFGVSMFAHDSVLSSDRWHKRPASPPPPVGSASKP